MVSMKQDLIYFFQLAKFNIKNALVLGTSFWIAIFGMILNNLVFFVTWYLFTYATGPINGWTNADIFATLAVSMFCFGVAHAFFNGIVELPDIVNQGKFDAVLLAPRNILIRLSGMTFSITAFGDIIMGLGVMLWYGVIRGFDLKTWLIFFGISFLGIIIFFCIRLLTSLVSFYIHDSKLISGQMFELFLRPGLYPGSIFPYKMKIIFMTIVPTLITSVVAIDFLKTENMSIIFISFASTIFWVILTAYVFKNAIKRYESGNFLR